MNRSQAMAIARTRWGADGWVWEGSFGSAIGVGQYRVGVWRLGGPIRFGSGSSWEAAFRDAARHSGTEAA